jgi:hypothetical protein
VHAIDERELERSAAKERPEVLAGEELVAGQAEDARAGRGLIDPRVRVYADCDRSFSDERQRSSAADADLQVSLWTELLVKLR